MSSPWICVFSDFIKHCSKQLRKLEGVSFWCDNDISPLPHTCNADPRELQVAILAWIFKEKWFWIVVLALITIILTPFIIVGVMLNLPPIFRVVGMVLLVLCWGVAGAYKEWTKSKREEEEKMQKSKAPSA
jgi:hypothetical protein